jgi:methyltransferase (TIGR00027 family)
LEQANKITGPDNTAVRTALWRALHVQVDAQPHILEDEIGLKLISPPDDWQERPDMKYTKRLRASIVARSRFIDDRVIEQSQMGINQYVVLGAGLDTFAQRRPDKASHLQIYEIDQPDTLAWKQKRLTDLGFGVPGNLHFVPVNFETSSWWEELLKKGFDQNKPAIVACTGVTLYLTKEAIVSTLSRLARLASGSHVAITFYLPMQLLDEKDKPMQEIAEKGARAAGTPFISFFSPDEILTFSYDAGFKTSELISTKEMEELYFINRTDHLAPASGEIFLLAKT